MRDKQPPRLTQATRLETLERAVAQMQMDQDAMREAVQETHDAVQAMAEALLKPQPGHDRNLLDRIAAVTIKAERGEWTLRLLLWAIGASATVLAALAAFKTWALS